MNKKMLVALMLTGVCLLLVTRVQGRAKGEQQAAGQSGQASVDQDIQLLRQDIASQKKQVIAANLVLADTEATKFWPIYDQYQAEYAKMAMPKLR